MGHCFKIKFGSPQLKAVAIALADHAHDDGTKIWPSVRALAEKTELSERTVQYKLRELEAAGLIVLVEEGGHGPKDTREYKFDMKILRGLSDGELELREEKGATDAPIKTLRVQQVQLRVQATTDKGAPGAPEPSLNHQEPSGAQARASDVNARAACAFRRQPRLVLATDPDWQIWFMFARERLGGGANAILDEQAMVVYDDAPWDHAQTPKLAPEQGSAKWDELFAARKHTQLSLSTEAA